MPRRSLLWIAAAALLVTTASCTEEIEDDMGKAEGQSPWLLWGSSQTVVLSVKSLLFSTPNTASPQLVQIRYKRPDTWRFFLYGKVLTALPDPGAGSGSVTVDWDLTFGVGRSTTRIPSFTRFQWNINADVGKLIFCTEVAGPTRTTAPADAARNLIQEIPAETIQLVANCTYSTGILSDVTLDVGAYFAPDTHVRPEWFNLNEGPDVQYPGGEDKGK